MSEISQGNREGAGTGADDVAYRATLKKIMDFLAPGNATKQNQNSAFSLLKEASEYKDDANLCSTLSDAIYAAQNNLAQVEKLKRENLLLEKERATVEWNDELTSKNLLLISHSSSKDSPVQQENQRIDRDARMARTKRQLSEVGQTIENNKARLALLEITAKGHLQSLIMQFFATRRFQHVIIANRFYRALYTDGDNSIEVFKKMVATNQDVGQVDLNAKFDPKAAGEVKGVGYVAPDGTYAPFGQSFSAQGMKLGVQNLGVESLMGGASTAALAVSKLISSLSQLDGLANEGIRDVNEGIEAYKFLLEKNEMKSATERLAETFTLGEFMPSVRLLSREDKRRALEFLQKGNELLATLEVNDLTRAAKLVDEVHQIASDFDASKPLAKIETAKTLVSMHLAKARNAVASGDKAAMEAELRSAAEIWPRNPALADVGGMIFSEFDLQQRAITDFDQLLSLKNYRQIFDDKMRFIAATAMFPEKQEQLRKVLDDMTKVEAAIIRAREVEKLGDFAGAWERAETASRQFPGDNKLNQVSADLTTKAPDFVCALKEAEAHEKKNSSARRWHGI